MANSGMGTADGAKLILRLTLGLLILFHGVSKILHGVGPITGMVAGHGLPPAAGYLVYVGEVVAPLMLVFGIWTRLAALVVVINMVVAVLLVHVSQFFTLGNAGGWALELQAMYLMTALAIVLLGAGRYSVGGSSGRWN
jgi:putative oxidoreductase